LSYTNIEAGWTTRVSGATLPVSPISAGESCRVELKPCMPASMLALRLSAAIPQPVARKNCLSAAGQQLQLRCFMEGRRSIA